MRQRSAKGYSTGRGMLILACDISTATKQNPFGWALFKDNHYLDSGSFVKPGDARKRIIAIGRWFDGMMAKTLMTKGPIRYVVLERPTGDHGNRKTDRMLGGVEHLLGDYLCDKYGAEFADVTPAEVIATGISKHNLAAGVAWIRNESGDPERKVGKDEVDAVGIALAFLRRERIFDA